MKRTLLTSLGLLAAVASSSGITILIGGSLGNGDFNADTSTTDQRSFVDTPSWVNLSTASNSQDQQATRLNVTLDGTRNAVLNLDGGRLFGNDPNHVIGLGDVFGVGYSWRDASAWNDAKDQVRVTLFTTADDQITGTRNVLVDDFSGLSTTNSTYEMVDHTGIYTATPADVNKKLFVEFTGYAGSTSDSYGFARLDNFTLTVPETGHTLPLFGLVLGGMALRLRRKQR